MKKMLGALIVFLAFTALPSCSFSIGPQVKTVYTLVYPGKPMEIVEGVKAKGIVLSGTGDPVVQDVGGWVAMPPEHWAAVERALQDLEARRAADKK